MPSCDDRSLKLVAQDENTWMQVYNSISLPGRTVRHARAPKPNSTRTKFLAWSIGMPPHTKYIRKTSGIHPENTWWDGAQVHYRESNPRYTFIADSPKKHGNNNDDDEEDDDDNNDDGAGHTPGGNCCTACASRCLPWHGYNAGWYLDDNGIWWDPNGNPVNTTNTHPEQVNWALPPRPQPEEPRRGRRYTRLESPERDDNGDGFVRRDSATGLPIRYSRLPAMPIYETPARGRGGGVEQYRWA